MEVSVSLSNNSRFTGIKRFPLKKALRARCIEEWRTAVYQRLFIELLGFPRDLLHEDF